MDTRGNKKKKEKIKGDNLWCNLESSALYFVEDTFVLIAKGDKRVPCRSESRSQKSSISNVRRCHNLDKHERDANSRAGDNSLTHPYC
ncbi:hypothetical protein BgiMline_012078 [Biomphalaria glabrata]|nr:hypothetical protein BgiMline_030677 [Biomphalaria glabrata]